MSVQQSVRLIKTRNTTKHTDKSSPKQTDRLTYCYFLCYFITKTSFYVKLNKENIILSYELSLRVAALVVLKN